MDRSNFDPQVGDSVRIRSWEDMKSELIRTSVKKQQTESAD